MSRRKSVRLFLRDIGSLKIRRSYPYYSLPGTLHYIYLFVNFGYNSLLSGKTVDVRQDQHNNTKS